MRRGLLLGCGGTVGGAWQIGALAAIERALDWDPRTAEVIVGTSAGATAAAMLGAGVPVGELVAAQRGSADARDSVRRFCTAPPSPVPAVPFGAPSLRLSLSGVRERHVLPALAGLLPAGRTDPGFLDDLVDDLVPRGEWAPRPGIWVVGTSLVTGQRARFGAPGAPRASLRDAVRASWAIPGWYPPVVIDGEPFVDGGVRSTASADAVAGLGLDEAIVVVPMASGARVPGVGGLVEGLMRRAMTGVLDAELAALEAAGTRVILVQPGAAELAAMGPNFMDPRRRTAALDVAIEHVGRRLGGRNATRP
ncbi:patatin-like phospholipase family protein [Nocardia thailandica]